MSVYKLFFVFGKPGSYMLDHPMRNTRQNMPEYVEDSFHEDKQITQVNCLALDAHGTFFLDWEDESGESWTKQSPRLKTDYPDLHKFLEKNVKKNCRVSFGSDIGDFFVTCDYVKPRWLSIGIRSPSDLATDKRNIKMLATGLGGAYVVIFENGQFLSSCSKNYPDLDELLDDQKRGDVVFVALNPHRRNEYFIALADGRVYIRASAICEADVSRVLRDYPELEIISSELTNFSKKITVESSLPPQARKKRFLKGIAKSAGGGVASSLVALALGASCVVM